MGKITKQELSPELLKIIEAGGNSNLDYATNESVDEKISNIDGKYLKKKIESNNGLTDYTLNDTNVQITSSSIQDLGAFGSKGFLEGVSSTKVPSGISYSLKLGDIWSNNGFTTYEFGLAKDDGTMTVSVQISSDKKVSVHKDGIKSSEILIPDPLPEGLSIRIENSYNSTAFIYLNNTLATSVFPTSLGTCPKFKITPTAGYKNYKLPTLYQLVQTGETIEANLVKMSNGNTLEYSLDDIKNDYRDYADNIIKNIGLGTDLIRANDINSLKKTGFYFYSGNQTPTNADYMIIHLHYSNINKQFAYSISGKSIHVRNKLDIGSYSAWQEVGGGGGGIELTNEVSEDTTKAITPKGVYDTRVEIAETTQGMFNMAMTNLGVVSDYVDELDISVGDTTTLKTTSKEVTGAINELFDRPSGDSPIDFIHSTGHTVSATGSALGESNIASGLNAIALGKKSEAPANNAFAVGDYARATGTSAVAIGSNSVANKLNATAIGSSAFASGSDATALGGGTASGSSSVAGGYMATASASGSVSLGYSTKASGNYAFASGYSTQATAEYAHANGASTLASNKYAHAGGYGTIADVFAGTAIGTRNKSDSGGNMAYVGTADALMIGNGTSALARSNAFRVTFDGRVYGLAAFNSTGADYAEFFEWLDGNPEAEERQGFFVTMDGEGIRKATSGDDYILGIVSVNPSVVGDSHQDNWNNMYVTDEWGRIQYHYVDIPAEVDAEGETIQEARQDYAPVLNPNWNPEEEYLPREERPEWSPIGIVGKMLVRDDGSCQVNGYCTSNDEGIATSSDTGYRVMKRISENIIQVFIK